jgi:transposase-like protein
MSTADLTAPQFTDETAAREHLEALRWPDGVFCPHCGGVEKITKMQGKSHRPGLFLCGDCRGHFSVTVGTVYERSHIPLHKWLLATHLLASSKKGISAHQLHRMLGITYKSAWFMCHRIREAMDDKTTTPMGGKGKTVEADETFIGQKVGHTKDSGAHHKMAVVTLVERGGRAKSFKVDKVTAADVVPIVRAHADKASNLMTDEARLYRKVGTEYASHGTVAHKRGEYGRGDIHTNTVEGFYSIFKRGMKGVYQHCSERHLQRYLAEFDFRYSNRIKLGVTDKERAEKVLKSIVGKRLTYRRTDKQPEAPSLGE